MLPAPRRTSASAPSASILSSPTRPGISPAPRSESSDRTSTYTASPSRPDRARTLRTQCWSASRLAPLSSLARCSSAVPSCVPAATPSTCTPESAPEPSRKPLDAARKGLEQPHRVRAGPPQGRRHRTAFAADVDRGALVEARDEGGDQAELGALVVNLRVDSAQIHSIALASISPGGIPTSGAGGVPKRQAGAGALPLDLAAALVGGALDHPVPAMQHRLQAGDRLGRVGGHLGGEVRGPRPRWRPPARPGGPGPCAGPRRR